MTSQASTDKRVEVRKQVWNKLYDHDELTNPTLPYNIIPNFKSMDAAIDRLLGLEVVKGTDKVLLSMEKSMVDVRGRMLEEKSTMYVMTYKTSQSAVCKVDCPDKNKTKFLMRQAASLYDKDKVTVIEPSEGEFDVLVVSSIAVSIKGDRITKADTLGDLEFPILSTLGYVGQNTIVITLVHDLQVVDDFPPAQHYNLPVDFIVTPTRVIECERMPKNGKIDWSLLKPEAVNEYIALKNLRYWQWKEGRDVRCHGEEENPSQLEEPVAKKAPSAAGPGGRRFRGGRKISFNDRKSGQRSDGRRRKISGKENGEEGEKRTVGYARKTRRYFGRQRRYFNSNRQFTNEEFKPAVYVGDLPKEMTSEAFSDLLASKGVHPASVVKAKETTHAFAIFEHSDDVNSQLSVLEGLTLEDKPLKIELSRRTARRQKTQQ